MAGRERLLDPTGDSDRTADTTLSPRLRSVRGLTVGLLENAKPNAAVLLSNVARELQRRHVVRVLNSPGALLVAVAGANNAGVSAVIETFGPRGGPPAVVRVADSSHAPRPVRQK